MKIDLNPIINFEYFIENNFSGDLIDEANCHFFENRINEKYPFIQIELKSESHLEYMLEDANDIHTLCSDNTFFIIAFYNKTDNFPVARAYFIKTKSIFDAGIFFKNNNIEPKIYSDNAYSVFLIQEGEYNKRILEYKKKKNSNQKNKIMKELFDGRKKHTDTNFGLRLSTESCIICKDKITTTVSTTFNGLYFNYDVCDNCHDDMQKNDISPINYFSRYYTGNDFIPVKRLSKKEILEEVKIFIKHELDSIIIRFNKKDTITALRKSGIKIIFRLTAMLDYGYMFFESKKGRQFARIDSADDHPDLKFRPDHLHNSKSNDDFNKNVTESFTTGMPIIDKKIILKIIEDKELEFNNKNQ